jgi:dTDP-4-amino-4,6-dideoxygalactose transaminase
LKRTLADLALFGGEPAFAEPLHVGRPNIGDRTRLLARIQNILDRKWLTNHGPYVHAFEETVAHMAGVKHCIAVCNGTVGLEIAIRALGLSGEVIVPSFTFVATAHALQWLGLTPVFCDIDPGTYTLDPAAVEALVTPRTSGILGVHVWGRPCAVEALDAIARRHRLKLLYDAAHAFGCSHNGRPIGSFGDAEVFSFHATKFVNTFEGGAIVTGDGELAARIRLMANFGFSDYDQVDSLGTNGKLNEISAAHGLTLLEELDAIVAANRSRFQMYRHHLCAVPGLRLLCGEAGDESNHQYVVVEVDEKRTGISRDRLVELLWAENVHARRYFHPGCHRMAPYRDLYPDAGRCLPHTEQASRRLLVLPTGPSLSGDMVAAVCDLLGFCAVHGPAIEERASRREDSPAQGSIPIGEAGHPAPG